MARAPLAALTQQLEAPDEDWPWACNPAMHRLSLTSLLKYVKARDYTYLRVYDGEVFAGLATSNGVARWLAKGVTEESLVEFGDHRVGEILSLEEARANVEFVAARAPVDDVVYTFQANVRLEAAVVTQNGHSSESLLGIATRWDIANLLPT